MPITLVLALLFCINKYCCKEISKFYPTTDINYLYGNNVKNKGVILINESVKNNHILFFGSSELNPNPKLHVTTNPTLFYPNQYTNAKCDVIGNKGAETLDTLIRLGSIKNINTVPVIYSSSFTWFIGNEYTKDGTLSQFSELQYYEFMNNDKVPLKVKQIVSSELVRLMKNKNMFHEVFLFAWLNTDNGLFKKSLKFVLLPYYIGRHQFLLFKDVINSYRLVMHHKNKTKESYRKINWNAETDAAYLQCKDLCYNDKNKFYVYKTWYDANTKKILKDKNSHLNYKTDASKEYLYHDMLLNTVNALNIQSIVVLNSVNGYYYDYIGITKDLRDNYYKKLANLQQFYNVSYIDLQPFEYEKYYFRDDAHYTSRGWLNINEKIIQILF